MIPENVDLVDLQEQLAVDNIALDKAAASHPTLHEGLEMALQYAEEREFGDVGVVVLSETPVVRADLRDIAQTLLDDGDHETIIVRAPHSGAIVSNVYDRATLEVVQYDFLRNPDYAAGVSTLVDDTLAGPVSMPLIYFLLSGVVLVALFVTLMQAKLKVKP